MFAIIKVFYFKTLKNVRSITLIELMISIIIVTIVVLSFYSLETFSQGQVINADRRAKVQNDLAYALEHMSKYVLMAEGNNRSPAIVFFPTGFFARVDFRNPQIPSDLSTNGARINYSFSGSTLRVNCNTYGSGSCGSFIPEILSGRIITFNATLGVAPLNNVLDIYLVGRYNPIKPIDRTTNPQVEMRTEVICPNSSTN